LKDLSIIIVNYRSGEKLARCLESIRVIEDSRFSFEVVVVDNQSNDGSLEENILMFPEFTFISNTGNNGFANGCNLGASISQGRTFLFLNPDTTVTADALYDMLVEVRMRQKYSIISYNQVQENETKERSRGIFLIRSTLNGWLRMMRQIFYGSFENSIVQAKYYAYPDWIFGSAFMINRDGFFQMGKWDEDFWMYFEDDDKYRKDKIDFGEIVKLKNGVIGHKYRCSSNIFSRTTVMIKTEINSSHTLNISGSNMAYESPCWF